MPLADFFDEGTQAPAGVPEELVNNEVQQEEKPSIDYEDLLRHIGELIASRYPITDAEKAKFVENFTFFGALLLTIVGFEDLENILSVLKPLPPFAKLGIIAGGFVLIFMFIKPRVPKTRKPVMLPHPKEEVHEEKQAVVVPPKKPNSKEHKIEAVTPDYAQNITQVKKEGEAK